MQIKITIYEDNLDYLKPLENLINSNSDFNLKGSFLDCTNIIEQTKLLKPDIILMDIELPEINGVEATKMVKDNYSEIDVMILSSHDINDYVFKAIMAGATGYILKGDSSTKITDAIKELHKGGSPMTPSIARKVLKLFNLNTNISEKQKLTEQQFKILNLMKRGLSYKMVAEELDIKLSTVQVHIKNIYGRLQVNSKSQAFRKLFR